MPLQREATTSVRQYGDGLRKRSLEDPQRYHRRSSIPFMGRKPSVRFIRTVEQNKRSISGPKIPHPERATTKPILKKTNAPILIASDAEFHYGETNDTLQSCRDSTEKLLEQISRAERVARGSMDILTFPCATRRLEILSRYYGCLVVCITCVQLLYTSKEFKESKSSASIHKLSCEIVALAKELSNSASSLCSSAKKLLSRMKRRYREADAIFASNSEFKVVRTTLVYPIYTHRRMPESVSVYEDNDEEDILQNSLDSYMRIYRQLPDEAVYCHFDTSSQTDLYEPIDLDLSPVLAKQEMTKFVIKHGGGILKTSNKVLQQSIEMMGDLELNEYINLLKEKLNLLQYDDKYDPLCSLELKNTLGELVDREADFLNTAEQIGFHCRQIKKVSSLFYRYTRRRLRPLCVSCLPTGISTKGLLSLLKPVSKEEVNVIFPMSPEVALNVFHVNSYESFPFPESQDESSASIEIAIKM